MFSSIIKKFACLNQERIMHKPTTVYKKKQYYTVLKCVGEFWCERITGMDFFTGGSVVFDYQVEMP